MLNLSRELGQETRSRGISNPEYRNLPPAAGGPRGQEAPRPEPGGHLGGAGRPLEQRRFLVRSFRALVQQIAVGYVARGYVYWVRGRIPRRKLEGGARACRADWKIMARYDANRSARECFRAKKNGEANVVYLRWEDVFVLLATEGKHPFFEAEGSAVRDIRKQPLTLGNYVISYKNRSALVDLKESLWKKLSGAMCERALMEKGALEEKLREEMGKWPAYKPIQNGWKKVIRRINERRKGHRLPFLKVELVPTKRWQQRVYVELERVEG